MAPFDTFRQAQEPISWAFAADELYEAALLIYYSAAEQLPRFEEARRAAEDVIQGSPAIDRDGFAWAPIHAPAPKFLPAFLMLGFAIENLLKGLYVTRNSDAVAQDRIGVPKTHDLEQLAQKAGFSLTPTEADLLRKLTTVISWSGRYPVAVTRQAYGDSLLDREAIFDDPVGSALEAQALFRKLRVLACDVPKDPAVGGVVVIWKDPKPT